MWDEGAMNAPLHGQYDPAAAHTRPELSSSSHERSHSQTLF